MESKEGFADGLIYAGDWFSKISNNAAEEEAIEEYLDYSLSFVRDHMDEILNTAVDKFYLKHPCGLSARTLDGNNRIEIKNKDELSNSLRWALNQSFDLSMARATAAALIAPSLLCLKDYETPVSDEEVFLMVEGVVYMAITRNREYRDFGDSFMQMVKQEPNKSRTTNGITFIVIAIFIGTILFYISS